MIPTATIVFREILEIALVLTIIMAATRGLSGRGMLVIAGLAIGVLGSLVIAFFTDAISQAIEGVGQEIFNAAIMFIATAFLSWTVIWMKRHGRELSQHLKQVGDDVLHGRRPLYMIVGIIALATFREGAEIVLFTYGMLASGSVTIANILAGAALGTVGGVAVGFAFYFGLLKATKKHFFSVTSWMLILLTAGIAAQGAGFLVAAGVLPPITPQLWDTSAFISGSSLMGEILGVLMGYTPRPSGVEVLCYAVVLTSITVGYYKAGRPASPHAQAVPSAT